jgi:hypothetical protein
MAQHRRKRRQKNQRRLQHVRPLAPEAFREAVLRANAAASTPHPLLQEGVDPSLILRDGNQEEAIALPDTPLMRALLTLRDCYPQPGDWRSAVWRCQALEGLLEQPALAPWIKPVETGWAVADPVLFVAATAPLDANGEFLLEPFCEALARWVAEHPEPSQAAAPEGA